MGKRYARRVLCGLALSLSVGALWAQQPAAAAVRVGGTGSGTGGMKLLAQSFTGATVDVRPAVGSAGGIAALIGGGLDVAVSNRAPNATEKAAANLVVVEYARTPFVMAVHRDLGITALTGQQLADVYAEGAARFPNGQRARPVMRAADAVDSVMTKALAPAVAIAYEAALTRAGMLQAATDTEAADLVTRVPGAIAATTLAQMLTEQRPFVALAIDGKQPSVDNLASGVWPHFKALYMVTRADAPEAVQRFAAYVQSAAGQKLLLSMGHAGARGR
jgi:phosphate transport system substrate-binding protein